MTAIGLPSCALAEGSVFSMRFESESKTGKANITGQRK
jgi:hypothetical protein